MGVSVGGSVGPVSARVNLGRGRRRGMSSAAGLGTGISSVVAIGLVVGSFLFGPGHYESCMSSARAGIQNAKYCESAYPDHSDSTVLDRKISDK